MQASKETCSNSDKKRQRSHGLEDFGGFGGGAREGSPWRLLSPARVCRALLETVRDGKIWGPMGGPHWHLTGTQLAPRGLLQVT